MSFSFTSAPSSSRLAETLRLLFLFFLRIAFFESGVVAATIETTNTTTAAASPAATLFPVPKLVATASDPLSHTYNDIHNYRTLFSIVQSCLLTIFACTWVAVHRNIPGPKQSWIAVQLECLRVVVMTLLVPEWVLAWAVRQWFRVREVASLLEDALAKA